MGAQQIPTIRTDSQTSKPRVRQAGPSLDKIEGTRLMAMVVTQPKVFQIKVEHLIQVYGDFSSGVARLC